MTITITDLFLGAMLAVLVLMAYQTIVEKLQERRNSSHHAPTSTHHMPMSQQTRDLLHPRTGSTALRVIQEHTHIGHDLGDRATQTFDRAVTQHAADPDDGEEPPNLDLIVEEVRRLVQSGQMVQALKYYRTHTGTALKDAKKAVQRIASSR